MRIISFLSLFLAAGIFFPLSATELVLKLKDVADYGSGASAGSGTWNPGGIEKLGILAGHANHLPLRKDRIVMRFNIGILYLKNNVSIKSAKLVLPIRNVDQPHDTNRDISVFMLPYETPVLSNADLLSGGEIFLGKLKNNKKILEFDVTSAVRKGYKERYMKVLFRITDSAEKKLNTTGGRRATSFQSPSTNDPLTPELRIKY